MKILKNIRKHVIFCVFVRDVFILCVNKNKFSVKETFRFPSSVVMSRNEVSKYLSRYHLLHSSSLCNEET